MEYSLFHLVTIDFRPTSRVRMLDVTTASAMTCMHASLTGCDVDCVIYTVHINNGRNECSEMTQRNQCEAKI